MKGKLQRTVEPAFGTLTQFMGLRKIDRIGLEQANKVMHLSAYEYHLKKYLKFKQKRSKNGAGQLALMALAKSVLQNLFQASMMLRNLDFHFLSRQEKSPVKELVFHLYFENHRLVQRLLLLCNRAYSFSSFSINLYMCDPNVFGYGSFVLFNFLALSIAVLVNGKNVSGFGFLLYPIP